jgi:hypothetical protein
MRRADVNLSIVLGAPEVRVSPGAEQYADEHRARMDKAEREAARDADMRDRAPRTITSPYVGTSRR